MSLTVSQELINHTTDPAFARNRGARQVADREIVIETIGLDETNLQDLIEAANHVGDSKTARAIEAIIGARKGKFSKIPSFKAFKGMLDAYVQEHLIDGWIYVERQDGKIYPELITRIAFDDGNGHRGGNNPHVAIYTAFQGCGGSSDRVAYGIQSGKHTFSPQSVVRKSVADVLLDAGILIETPALKRQHMESLDRFKTHIRDQFAEQFRVNGKPLNFVDDNWKRRNETLADRKAIHDLSPADYGPYVEFAETALFEDGEQDAGLLPEHPVVRLFDLKSHEFYWVHSDNLELYRYDKSLRDKLVLPKSHRDLLDVLTSDLDAFVGDIIEGKSAGNVILCKGIAGVGKTLTAEVYAELIERPLYSIHAGSLGTTAERIDKSLQTIFGRAKRWACVLLLDEADVFVVRRGNNIEQNAIVAEFLRTLEYFDGLMFMTTNRPDDIDEAIISRCAAIINYQAPGRNDAGSIWRVMADQYEVELPEALVTELLDLFPTIAPRDIKMLFRLALRVAKSQGDDLTIETFRRCAMFRDVVMS